MALLNTPSSVTNECHKGEEGKPLSTYDFASDENPNKNRAREMLRMLNEIEVHLNKIEPSGDKRVNMSPLSSWPPETHDPRRGTKRRVSKEGFASGVRRLPRSQEKVLRTSGL